MDILDKIILNKKYQLLEEKKVRGLDFFKKKKFKESNFKKEIKKTIQQSFAIIAEIKKASPSKGIFRKKFNHLEIAKEYIDNGACCLSVITEKKFFLGNKKFITDIKNKFNVPILAKDFFVDIYQVYEAKYIGADCILILLNSVNDILLHDLYSAAKECKMDVILEVHNETELQRALKYKSCIIGINNRNLKTFNTNINTSINLSKKINLSKTLVIAESGINSKKSMEKIYKKSGIKSFLIGESLIKSRDIGQKLRSFL